MQVQNMGGKRQDGSPRGKGALEGERRAKKGKGRATYMQKREMKKREKQEKEVGGKTNLTR